MTLLVCRTTSLMMRNSSMCVLVRVGGLETGLETEMDRNGQKWNTVL